MEDRVRELEEAIRQHRDERGDDRCHADDGRLYAVLPEGDTRPERETAVTVENCQGYIACRQTGREYVSPQRRIEELEQAASQMFAALLAAKAFGSQGDTEPEGYSVSNIIDLALMGAERAALKPARFPNAAEDIFWKI